MGRKSGDRARHVKLRHLLAHNSGLPGYVEVSCTVATPAALLRACLELPLESEPGARTEYSDPGFLLIFNSWPHAGILLQKLIKRKGLVRVHVQGDSG